jgi:predicted secreted protein
MTPVSAIAVYFIIWWLTLFIVLPFGVRSQAEADQLVPGTEPGAPLKPRLWIKLLINTCLAGIVFLGWVVATRYFGFDLNNLPSIFPQDR